MKSKDPLFQQFQGFQIKGMALLQGGSEYVWETTGNISQDSQGCTNSVEDAYEEEDLFTVSVTPLPGEPSPMGPPIHGTRYISVCDIGTNC